MMNHLLTSHACVPSDLLVQLIKSNNLHELSLWSQSEQASPLPRSAWFIQVEYVHVIPWRLKIRSRIGDVSWGCKMQMEKFLPTIKGDVKFAWYTEGEKAPDPN